MGDKKIITDLSPLEKRPLAAYLKSILDPRSFQQVFARLARLYLQSQNKSYELEESLPPLPSHFLMGILNRLLAQNIESFAMVKLQSVMPKMPWMWRGVHKGVVKDGLRQSIHLTFEQALKQRYPLETAFDYFNVIRRLDNFFGTEYGIVSDGNRYEDGLLARNFNQMSKRFETILGLDIKYTIWESIIRADIRLLYTYFACVMSKRNPDDVNLLQDLVDLRFAAMPIGKKDNHKWTILVEGKIK